MASILIHNRRSISVCVPACWTDAQVEAWVNTMLEAHGWKLVVTAATIVCARMPGHVHRELVV